MVLKRLVHAKKSQGKRIPGYRRDRLAVAAFGFLLVGTSLSPGFGSLTGSIGTASAFTGTGVGTAGDPYLIDTCEELQSIGATEQTHDRLYRLTSNIDCSATSSWNAGAGFEPLPDFDGTLDGQGYTISNLSINRPSDSEVGLFTRLQSDAMVTRLSLDNATIIGSNFTGAIASQASYAIIRDVHVDGTVSTSENYAGGLVGSAMGWENDSVFQRSSFTGSITSASFAGGILGQGYYGFTLEDVYVDATINSGVTGGLMGQGFASCGYRYINRALVKGALSGSSFVGGFTGKYENISCNVNQVNNSVSLATLSGVGDKGGAVGNLGGASVTFDNIYFDQAAAGTSNCVGSGSGSSGTCGDIGSNVAPAGEPYAQWDFSTVWQENAGTITQRPTSSQTGPNPITGLAAVLGDPTNSVDVSWTAPGSLGSYALLRYRAEIKEADDTWSNVIDSNNDTSTNVSFQNLKLGNEYDIRVAAITEYSISDWVEISYSTPDPEVFTVNTCAELDDLDQLGNHLDTYLLGTDIDCSGYPGFTPLDWGSDFGGTFDGQGYSISNLNILVVDSGHVGLFSITSNALLQNLTIDDATILGTEDSYYCGALAGYTRNTNIYNVEVHDLSITCSETVGGVVGRFESEDPGVAEVENVSVSGDVIAEGTEVDYGWGPYIEGGYIAGGLFGRVDASYEGSVIISQSFSNATVVADSSRAGGIIGEANSEIEEDTNIPTTLLVQDSYSTGSVTGGYNVGGIIGAMEAYNDGYDAVSEIEIENAYSSASVNADYSAGGIVGYMDDPYEEGEQYVLNNVFAAGIVIADDLAYALIGSDDGLGDGSLVINNSYFDQTATGQAEATAYDDTVSGWTAVNMDGSESDYFKNNTSNPPLDQWDFEGVWLTRETDYPILQWNPFSEETDDSDLNGDEIPDSEQPNIGGYISPITNKLVAIDVGEQCELTTDDMTTEANLSVQDPAYEYENGLWDFEADCGTLGYTTTIKLYYYNIDKSNLILRKHNPTTKAFFNINDAVISSQTIGGQNVTVVTYQVTDGGERDIDGFADGMINDPAGLARSLVGAPNTGIR